MSDPMRNDKLDRLKALRTPVPGEAAKQRALAAAMEAYDRQEAAKGTGAAGRLRSMILLVRRTFSMSAPLSYGLGTAAVALLLLPLGYQLYTSTAIVPVSVPSPAENTASGIAPDPLKEGGSGVRRDVDATAAAPGDEADTEAGVVTMRQAQNGAAAVQRPEAGFSLDAMPAPAEPRDAASANSAAAPPAPMESFAPRLQSKLSGGQMAVPSAPSSRAEFAPAPVMPHSVPSEGDQFTSFDESPVKIVAEQPVSTFSIDVDTASYSYVRRMLADGVLPEPDAVRLEELINYFPYDYPAATDAGAPFKPTISVIPTPWNTRTRLVEIGIKGYVPPATEHKPANLVFLIDTSGSMDEPDKLPLLKRAFALLVDTLTEQDKVSIVAYAGSAGIVLPPTSAGEKSKILAALENLSAGGSTAGAEGIELAYRMAEQAKITGGTNRVILATDGDFNVGIDDPDDLKTFIKAKRETGVFLSVLGFGEGNLGDDTIQALAQNGNGNASYIDSFREAQKVLVAEGGGTLDTIAKDVKIQVEFNPAVVSEYRLIGYETRALRREDFNNDKVDAGDVGAGTTVTALYEITPKGSGAELSDPLRYGTAKAPGTAGEGEIGYLKLRYKRPDSDTSELIEQPISSTRAVADLSQASADARWAAAVAAFGQKLKGSAYGAMSWAAIRSLAQGARGSDEAGYRAEFMQLIDGAATLAPDTGSAGPDMK